MFKKHEYKPACIVIQNINVYNNYYKGSRSHLIPNLILPINIKKSVIFLSMC